MIMKYCPKCKKIFRDGMSFCGDCGASLQIMEEDVIESKADTQRVDSVAQQSDAVKQENYAHQNSYSINQASNSAVITNVARLEKCTASFYGEMSALVKDNRLGRGGYALLSVLRLVILDILTVVLIYNEVDKIMALSQFGKGMSSIPSLPSATPLFILVIVNFAAIMYMMYKRLKDMGLKFHYIQLVLGIYGVLAVYAVWSIHNGMDTIVSAILNSTMNIFGKGALDLLMSANDIVFAMKTIAILYIVALCMTFFKGTPGRNEYGDKPGGI